MSNVSQYHNVNLFVAGKSQPLTGQRLSKVGYKSSKSNTARFASVCVSVPKISFDALSESQIESLKPQLIEILNSAQDGIIRSLYESSEGQLKTISDSEISINSCIAYLQSESSGGRLTKDLLDSWFDSNIRDNLMVVIADKLKFDDITEENSPVILKHVGVYKELIQSLSSPRTILQPIQLSSIKKVLELNPNDDEISKKLIARIQMMEEKPKLEELLEL